MLDWNADVHVGVPNIRQIDVACRASVALESASWLPPQPNDLAVIEPVTEGTPQL